MDESTFIHEIGTSLAMWAGDLDDDQRARFAEALQHASIPEACETIADSIRERTNCIPETCPYEVEYLKPDQDHAFITVHALDERDAIAKAARILGLSNTDACSAYPA